MPRALIMTSPNAKPHASMVGDTAIEWRWSGKTGKTGKRIEVLETPENAAALAFLTEPGNFPAGLYAWENRAEEAPAVTPQAPENVATLVDIVPAEIARHLIARGQWPGEWTLASLVPGDRGGSPSVDPGAPAVPADGSQSPLVTHEAQGGGDNGTGDVTRLVDDKQVSSAPESDVSAAQGSLFAESSAGGDERMATLTALVREEAASAGAPPSLSKFNAMLKVHEHKALGPLSREEYELIKSNLVP